VAVKVLHRDLAQSPEMIERFVLEARAVNLIRHPNIVDIYEFGQLRDGRPYYVMELLEGASLRELIEQHGRFSPREALDILAPLVEALAAAHAAGVIHRDLKASNVMVQALADGRRVKLLDFGIAKLIDPDASATGLTSVGRLIGTPDAMSPEQIRGGKIDARTDVYAMGVLLYQLLVGRMPFVAASPVEVQAMHLETPPPRPSESSAVGAAIDAVVLRCMEKDAARRFDGVAQVADALRDAIARPSGGGAAQLKRAVGIYLTVHAKDAEAELEDAVLDDTASVLVRAREMLRGAGWMIPLETGTTVLAVWAVDEEEPDADRRDRRAALDLALRLRGALDGRPGPDPRVEIVICVHADRAIVRGSEVVGGPISRIGSWVDAAPSRGVAGTSAAVAGLDAAGVTVIAT
jgi:serine/threonine-protein kinase